ncbi:MAG: hypothetical protein PWP58_1601 [Bacillota bacterium]|jgi:hypothetical protein|nr:hypothetical protein [Bacillota bacterium]
MKPGNQSGVPDPVPSPAGAFLKDKRSVKRPLPFGKGPLLTPGGKKMRIDRREVVRYLGLKRGKELDARWEERVEEAVAEAEELLRPALSWRTYPVAQVGETKITLAGTELTVTGPRMVRRLAGAERITALAVTCGPALEEAAAAAFARGEYVRGAILDAAGSAAAEALADEVNDSVAAEAQSEGYCLLPRVSPGYADWDLAVQPQLIRAAGAERLGISLSKALLLIPRKSVTAVIAWVKRPEVGVGGCLACPRTNCRYRREGER